MRALLAAALTIVGVSSGQTDVDDKVRDELAATFLSLHRAGEENQRADTLTARILAVPAVAHQPNRLTLTAFSLGLARALAGRELSRPVAALLAADISGALRSESMGTLDFREHVAGFGRTLSRLGVSASAIRSLTAKLRTAGEEVRGPQDMPVWPLE